ncbi:glutamate--tRNA ligase [Candidatus Dependentiae bacterium]|nr:glutamate--tRNA ligase [Candidatus Dependentiae bacterium]
MSGEIRVRFAPSPTGKLHIGGIRTALFNYLFARTKKGKFIIRIEDSDFERSKDEFVIDICESLKWVGLDWDEGPLKEDYNTKNEYFQSQRLDTYKSKADELLNSGKAYRCFCSHDRLKELKDIQRQRKDAVFGYDGFCRNLTPQEITEKLNNNEKFTIRIKRPDTPEISFCDLIRGEISFRSDTLDDFIIIRSDGRPVYNFTVVVDDYLMGITHVIRGEDHISNTPKQIILYKLFDWRIPEFGHLPLIFGDDGKRLSKRHGAVSILEYKKEGFLREAILNYLALLGWSYDSEREIFSKEELIELFEISKISKTAARFSIDKLLWFNCLYIHELSREARLSILIPFLKDAGIISELTDHVKEKLFAIIEIAGDRIKKLPDLNFYAKPFFFKPEEFNEKGVRKFLKAENIQVIKHIGKLFKEIDEIDFKREKIEEIIKIESETSGIKSGKIIQGLRVLLTGGMISAGLFETIEIMGRDEVVRRIEMFQ